MPKTTSKTATATAPVVASTEAKTAKTPKTKTPKVEAAPAPAPVSAPVVETATTEVAAPASDVEAQLAEKSNEFLSKLQQMSVMISSLKTEYRTLERQWTREVKAAQKVSSKRKRKAGNRAPSGFVKPTKISDELASFLGKEKGTEMARTDVTKEINNYIRANKLQDKDNGRKIIPDNKLASLLKLKKTDELTYFNLQKYMSPHFAKAVKPEATA